jgi:GrpB-like predicted nucleotidyltransferase (UPF0157 family)
MAEPVVIVDHDPEWPWVFERLRGRIAPAVGEVAISIEHVGGTAVPGLAAKPIIDVDVVVRGGDVPEAIRRMVTLGYRHQGDRGVPSREASSHRRMNRATTSTWWLKEARHIGVMCGSGTTCGHIRRMCAPTVS